MNQPQGTSSGKRHSTNMILKPAFQWKYTVATVVLVFCVSLIVSAEAYGILYHQARSQALYQPAVTGGEMVGSLVLLAAVLASIPALALGLWSIIVTHRMCGPLFVLERYLSELIDGRFPKRRPLRKKDEFKDFYEVFWQAMHTLEHAKRSDLNTVTEIRDLARLAAQADDESRKSAVEVIHTRSETFCAETARALGVNPDEITPGRSYEQRPNTTPDKEYASAAG